MTAETTKRLHFSTARFCRAAVPGAVLLLSCLLFGCKGAPAAAADAVETAADVVSPVDVNAAEVAADAQAPDTAPALTVTLHGATVAGLGLADVDFAGADIAAVRTGAAIANIPAGVNVVDVTGMWLAPAAIDSHVHLLIMKEWAKMAAGGVAVAVDLAAPVEVFQTNFEPLQVLASGPMLTAPGGYPIMSWGKQGFAIGVANGPAAADAVKMLAGMGARAIKVPLETGPKLSLETLQAAVVAAHQLGLPVVTHALREVDAMTAANAGVDALAHTPFQPLSQATVQAWSGRAVISTLVSYGRQIGVQNIARLRSAGVTVLYGTDFGKTTPAGIQEAELTLLLQSGMDGEAILKSMTTAPAEFWKLPRHGTIAVGKAASVLVLSADPLSTPLTLAKPAHVWLEGKLVAP